MRFRPLGMIGALLGGWVYVLALFLPVVTIYSGGAPDLGYDAYLEGWRAVNAPVPGWWDIGRLALAASWFANPAIWIALICLAIGWWRAAALAGAAGLILCLAVLSQYWEIILAGPAYWAWLASAALPLVWGSIAATQERRPRPWQPPERVELHFPTRLADGRWALTSEDEGKDDEGVTPGRPPGPERTDGP